MAISRPNDLIEIEFGPAGAATVITPSQLASFVTELEGLFDAVAAATGQSYRAKFDLYEAVQGSLIARLRLSLIATGKYVPGFLTPIRPWLGVSADVAQIAQFLQPTVISVLIAAGVAIPEFEWPATKNATVAIEIGASVAKNVRVTENIAKMVQSSVDSGAGQVTIRVADAPAVALVEADQPLRGQIASQAKDRFPRSATDRGFPDLMAKVRLVIIAAPIRVLHNGRERLCALGTELVPSAADGRARTLAVILPLNSPTIPPGGTMDIDAWVMSDLPALEPLEKVPAGFIQADGVVLDVHSM